MTGMLRVVIERDVRCAHILRTFGRDIAAAIIILLPVNGIGRANHQTQPAALRNPPRKVWERAELVAVDLAGRHPLGFS